QVALRKAQNFLDAGALVHIIAPQLHPDVLALYKEKKITWDKKRIEKKDIRQAALIVSATDEREVNEAVSRWAGEKGIRINVVDQPRISDFISPAVIREGKALVAVYTDGRDPVLSRDLKNFLKENWNDFLSYRDRS
ncbi:MAG: bifunctional precorrin-2 dehydrogenase/sirohydrochlorin ferrochelatase, partial [Candidatus Omnitrophica bacterium]|nr:bifunctional precorrin-2 dehydrogenase/sirohydrochlorin ferrochelatase [Candidatus Omnitrophota bacterium]